MKVVVAAASAEQPPDIKNLCSVTPQEEILAPYFALANNIKAGLCASDISAWSTFFRTTLFTFKVLRDADAKEFATLGLRQEAAAKYFAVAYTPIQWIYKIVQMKRDREFISGNRMSNDDLSKLFDAHKFKTVKGQEEISTTFVENALYIWRSALCYTDVQEALIRGAEVFSHDSMFDSVSKIAKVIRRCKMMADQVQWSFCIMLDRALEGFTSIGEMSNQSLFGTQTSKGHIDVMLALLELKDKLLYEIVPTLGLSAPVMHALQTHFNSVTAYRKKVPPMLPAPTGGDTLTRSEPDFTWMAAWSLPEKKVAQFIEGILYKDHYKRELKQIVANRQGASEVLKVESVAAVWNAVAEAVANELKSTLGGSAPVDQDPVEQEPSDETLEQVTFIPASADEVAWGDD